MCGHTLTQAELSEAAPTHEVHIWEPVPIKVTDELHLIGTAKLGRPIVPTQRQRHGEQVLPERRPAVDPQSADVARLPVVHAVHVWPTVAVEVPEPRAVVEQVRRRAERARRR